LQEIGNVVIQHVNLWLDDIRDPAQHGAIGFVWVKTAQEAIDLLATGTVRFASLDHDLDTDATMGRAPRERTGYDVVLWMEENDVWPRHGVRVHSMNPSGAAKMRQAIHRKYGCIFSGIPDHLFPFGR
jgi:hypothetical protein